MMRLIGIELRRLVSRRLVRLTVVGVFAMLTLISVVMGVKDSKDLGAARASLVAELTRDQASGADLGVSCDGDAATPVIDGTTGAKSLPPNCHALTPEQAADEQMQYRDPRFVFDRDGLNMLIAGVMIAGLLAFILAASGIGAEWGSGMLASLLTWEPRRQRVLAAKTLASIGFFTVVGSLVIGYQLLSAWVLATTRGTFENVSHEKSAAVGDVAALVEGAVGRGIGFVAIAAAAGVAVAGISRSTAGAMAILGGYLVVVEIGARALFGGTGRWLLTSNVQALLFGTYTKELFNSPRLANGEVQVFTMTAAQGVVVLLAVLAALTVVHTALMQRRDAT